MNSETLLTIRQISDRLKKKYKADRVILFGSYAKGEKKTDRDIGLLVIASVKESFYKRVPREKTLIRELRNSLPVAPIVLTKKELQSRINMKDQFLMDIVENGMVL